MTEPETPICPNGYREEHTFPSGLEVTYYTELDKQYVKERNAVATDDDLQRLRDRWRYLFPEIATGDLKAETLVALHASDQMQGDFANRAAQEPLCGHYLNVLFPRTMLALVLPAMRFNVSTGLVLLQMWNAGVIHEAEDGTWIIYQPVNSTQREQGAEVPLHKREPPKDPGCPPDIASS